MKEPVIAPKSRLGNIVSCGAVYPEIIVSLKAADLQVEERVRIQSVKEYIRDIVYPDNKGCVLKFPLVPEFFGGFRPDMPMYMAEMGMDHRKGYAVGSEGNRVSLSYCPYDLSKPLLREHFPWLLQLSMPSGCLRQLLM